MSDRHFSTKIDTFGLACSARCAEKFHLVHAALKMTHFSVPRVAAMLDLCLKQCKEHSAQAVTLTDWNEAWLALVADLPVHVGQVAGGAVRDAVKPDACGLTAVFAENAAHDAAALEVNKIIVAALVEAERQFPDAAKAA